MTRNRRGTILVASLWILTILSVLAIGIAFRMSVAMRLVKYDLDRIKGGYLARAGIMLAQELMKKDTNAYDSLYECGVTLANQTDSNTTISGIFQNRELGGGVFSVGYTASGIYFSGMQDEQGKVNINTASQQVLENLLSKTSVDKSAVAASIIRWRSPAGAGSSDDSYYASLEHPYPCKHAIFSSLEELLLVKGMTNAAYDLIVPYITVYTDGKVNVNTASREAFIALGLKENVADAIVRYRNGDDNIPATKDDRIFDSTNIEVTAGLNISAEDWAPMANLKNSFTTKSDCFRIEANGTPRGSRIARRVTCVVKRGTDKEGCSILYYRE